MTRRAIGKGLGLAAILTFVGAKMLLADVFHIEIGPALAVIATILSLSILASLIWPLQPEQLAGSTNAIQAGLARFRPILSGY